MKTKNTAKNKNQFALDFDAKTASEQRYVDEMMLELEGVSMKELAALDDSPEVTKKTVVLGDYGLREYTILTKDYNPCILHIAA